VLASEPELELIDCPTFSPTVTSELLAIELHTLGIATSPTMIWRIRCHGQSATVELRNSSGSGAAPRAGERGIIAQESIHIPVSMSIDLSTTDEGAWPRLIAISASELAAQSMTSTATAPLQKRALVPRVEVVAFDAKTPRRTRYLPGVGFALTHLGKPGAWLYGPTLGAELRIERVALFGTDLRAAWGKSTLADANVAWQLISVAAFGGYALDLGPVEASALLGMRVGRLRLKGEAKSVETSGRELVGPTGGPLVALRLRTAPSQGLFWGVNLELGYSVWSVRGNYDGQAPLLVVDGAWTSAAANVGWAF
jgi:hypothetical protein